MKLRTQVGYERVGNAGEATLRKANDEEVRIRGWRQRPRKR